MIKFHVRYESQAVLYVRCMKLDRYLPPNINMRLEDFERFRVDYVSLFRDNGFSLSSACCQNSFFYIPGRNCFAIPHSEFCLTFAYYIPLSLWL